MPSDYGECKSISCIISCFPVSASFYWFHATVFFSKCTSTLLLFTNAVPLFFLSLFVFYLHLPSFICVYLRILHLRQSVPFSFPVCRPFAFLFQLCSSIFLRFRSTPIILMLLNALPRSFTLAFCLFCLQIFRRISVGFSVLRLAP